MYRIRFHKSPMATPTCSMITVILVACQARALHTPIILWQEQFVRKEHIPYAYRTSLYHTPGKEQDLPDVRVHVASGAGVLEGTLWSDVQHHAAPNEREPLCDGQGVEGAQMACGGGFHTMCPARPAPVRPAGLRPGVRQGPAGPRPAAARRRRGAPASGRS